MSGQILQPIKGLANTHSKISLTQYNRMVGNVNSLSAMVSGGQGVLSSMTAGNIRTNINAMRHAFEEQLIHFTHEVVTPAYPYTGKAAIAIHCGRWSNGVATLLCDTGNTTTSSTPSGSYDDFFTVTDIDDDGYICLIRDEINATMKPVFSATFPDTSEIGVTAFPLLRISWHTVDPSIPGDVERLDKVEPLWFGGDIVERLHSHYPFELENDPGNPAKVRIRAGRVQVGDTQVLMDVDGGGTSGDWTSFKTIEPSGASWVYLILSPEINPTQVQVGYDNTDYGGVYGKYPTGDAKYLLIGYVPDLTYNVQPVVQLWRGGNFIMPAALWQTAISGPSGGSNIDSECRTSVNSILTALRLAGIIKT